MPAPFSVNRSADNVHVSLEINGTTFTLTTSEARQLSRRLEQIAEDIEADNPSGGRGRRRPR